MLARRRAKNIFICPWGIVIECDQPNLVVQNSSPHGLMVYLRLCCSCSVGSTLFLSLPSDFGGVILANVSGTNDIWHLPAIVVMKLIFTFDVVVMKLMFLCDAVLDCSICEYGVYPQNTIGLLERSFLPRIRMQRLWSALLITRWGFVYFLVCSQDEIFKTMHKWPCHTILKFALSWERETLTSKQY